MDHVCVFDVNETLLDMSALDPLFEQMFGSASVRQEWFHQVMQTALVSTVTGRYADFTEIGRAALSMIEQRRAKPLTTDQRKELLGAMRKLPPHHDAHDALERLSSAGVRLAALTNNTADTVEAQLAQAGLRQYFERVFSADSVRRLKPAPEPYRMVARELGISIGEIRLIAAHAWDIAGACAVGCATAFVARPGKVLDPLVPQPDIIGADLRAVAIELLDTEQASLMS